MVIQKKNRGVRRWLRAASFRWECIRRSKFYRADCEEFYSQFEGWFAKQGLRIRILTPVTLREWLIESERRRRTNSPSSVYFDRKVAPYLFAFSIKWGTFYPFSFEYSFDANEPATELMGIGLTENENIDTGTPIGQLTHKATALFQQKVDTNLRKLPTPPNPNHEILLYIPAFTGEQGHIPLISLPAEQWDKVIESVDEIPKLSELPWVQALLKMLPLEAEALMLGT